MIADQQIDGADVLEELDRIVQSPPFQKSKILSAFLTFVVQQKLNGNEEHLKEYVIGTEVLKKGSAFDPQSDAIVRIHALRLRRYLQEYYRIYGLDDPVKISIPVGRYVPVFEGNTESQIVREGLGTLHSFPRIAIAAQAIKERSEDLQVICSSLCRDLGIELSKYRELSIISSYSVELALSHPKGLEEIINGLRPDYLLLVSCSLMNDSIRATIELHAIRKSQLIWADSYSTSYQQQAHIDYREIIRKVVSNISGFVGIIFQDLLSKDDIQTDFEHMNAIYWHNRFHSQFSPEAFAEASAAIETGLKKQPNNSLLHSIKAELLLNQRTMETEFEVDPLDEGMGFAAKSVSLDHSNQHAWTMLAWAYIMRHNREMATEAMEKALALNPNNSLYLCNLGFGFVCVGEYEKAWELLSTAVESPYYFWTANVGLSLYFLAQRNYDEAYFWARLIERPSFPWDPMLRACCAGHLGLNEAAVASKGELLALHPDFERKAKRFVGTFLLDRSLQEVMLDGLKQVGFRVD